MGLSKEEKAQLEALTKKANEPDPPAHNVGFTLDLSSDTAWERAVKLGIVPGEQEEEEEGEEGEGEEAPRRKGYFG